MSALDFESNLDSQRLSHGDQMTNSMRRTGVKDLRDTDPSSTVKQLISLLCEYASSTGVTSFLDSMERGKCNYSAYRETGN